MAFDSPARWQQARSFHHSRYGEALLTARECSISVCLPARDCAGTVGPIVAALVALRERGGIDQLVVIDGGSSDATAQIAADAGATVFSESALMTGYGPVAGKGDAMWRSLSVLEGELICFLDADVLEFSTRYAVGLLGPLLELEEVEFVKAYYRRPFSQGADSVGRRWRPCQPPACSAGAGDLLSGARGRPPAAGRRDRCASLAAASGCRSRRATAVEIAMLLDVLEAVGLDGMAQVDLDVHRNSHQPLLELSAMAYTVLAVLAARLERDGRLLDLDASPLLLDGVAVVAAPLLERPPMVSAR